MSPKAVIRMISSFLPETVLTNEDISTRFDNWTPEKIYSKTGIKSRHIAKDNETATDFAVKAALKLFKTGIVSPNQIDVLVYCTQSPDYILPSSSCLIQHRLGLPTSTMTFDFTLGCSGYVYGLAITKALIENGIGKKALLLTGDTYTKYIHPYDRSVATLFGDAATATYIEATETDTLEPIGPFLFGTDGSGANNLIIESGGCLKPGIVGNSEKKNDPDSANAPEYLHMNGSEIFVFTLKTVPNVIHKMLEKTNMKLDDVDMYIFHQANKFMLENLRVKIGIPIEKFIIDMEDVGNTVSSTIPIVIERGLKSGRIKPGMRLMLVGFGVGYSWAACMIQTDSSLSAPEA